VASIRAVTRTRRHGLMFATGAHRGAARDGMGSGMWARAPRRPTAVRAPADSGSLPAMPRSFDLSAESPASVEQVHSAFSDEDYWRARLAAFYTGTATLESLIVDADGTVIVATTLSHFLGRLPKLATPWGRGDLAMVHNETWSQIGGGRVRGEVSVAAPGAPLSALGAALLAPVRNGSRLKYTATVQVKVPLVGGKIESFMAGQLAEGITAIQRFTTAWIADNG